MTVTDAKFPFDYPTLYKAAAIAIFVGVTAAVVTTISIASISEQQEMDKAKAYLKGKCARDLDGNFLPIVSLDKDTFRRTADIYSEPRLRYDGDKAVITGYIPAIRDQSVRLFDARDVRIVTCPPNKP